MGPSSFDYIRLIGGIFLTSPLTFTVIYLDYGKKVAFLTTLGFYLLLPPLGICLFHYLVYGKFTLKIPKNGTNN